MFTRFNGNVEPFAKDATGTERTVFGDTAQSDDINDNLNADFLRGWGIVGVNDNPTKQDFNALAYTISNLVAYLYQQGVSEWNTDQEYLTNSYCVGSDGKLYRAKTGTTGSPNQANNPTTDSVNWENLDSKFVDLVNAQTIAGIKTFSSFPVTPSSVPSSDYQTANKKYVDDEINNITNMPTVSGIAVFTNNNNNIEMTGIGLLEGLEVGDVIQVSGSTNNNKEFTVEIISDSNNIIVNAAHAGGTTSKSLNNDTATVTIKLLCKWYNAPSGLGLGFVTMSKNINTIYVDNFNREIQNVISVDPTTGLEDVKFKIDDNVVFENPNLDNTYYQVYTVNTGSGEEYEFSSNTITIVNWSQRR